MKIDIMEDTFEEKTYSKKLLSFSLLCSVYFLNVLARIIFSPLVPLICKDLSLSPLEGGNLFFIISLGFGISLFSSQYISAKISHRYTIFFSALLTSLSLIGISYSQDWGSCKLLIFFLGLSCGLFLPSAITIITEITEEKHWGKAFGIFAIFQSTAYITAPFIVRVSQSFFSWKSMLAIQGSATLIFSVFLLFALPSSSKKSESSSFAFFYSLFSFRSFWIVMALLCLVTGLNVGIYNMVPDYFSRHALIPSNHIYSYMILARAIGIMAILFAGYIVDYFGLKKTISFALILCGLATALLGFLKPSSALLLFCIQSPIAICLTPMIHVAISKIAPPGKNAAIVSIISSVGFLVGSGIVPQMLGFFGALDIYAYGFIAFGILSLSTGLILDTKASFESLAVSQEELKS